MRTIDISSIFEKHAVYKSLDISFSGAVSQQTQFSTKHFLSFQPSLQGQFVDRERIFQTDRLGMILSPAYLVEKYLDVALPKEEMD